MKNYNLCLEKSVPEKLRKLKKNCILQHFSIYRYRPIMQLSYWYRYRPIWKYDISVVISIGRYEKTLIGRPLSGLDKWLSVVVKQLAEFICSLVLIVFLTKIYRYWLSSPFDDFIWWWYVLIRKTQLLP